MAGGFKPAILSETYAILAGREAEWAERKSEVWGLRTPFAGLNKLSGGLQPGVTVLGARTSHGKSAAGMQFAFHAAHECVEDEGGLVMVFSPEMTPMQLMERYATQESGVPSDLIKKGKATTDQREEWLTQAKLMAGLQPYLKVFAGNRQTLGDITAAIQDALEDGTVPKFILIDYIQRVHLADASGRLSEVQALSRMMDDLQSLAARHELTMMIASQLNRNVERDNQTGRNVEREPEMSDLKGSGSLEEDADSVLLLWRPPHPETLTDKVEAQEATFFLRKNRHGAVGEFRMEYFPRLVKFADPGRPHVKSDGGGG